MPAAASMIGTADLYAAKVFSLSPDSANAITFLMAVRRLLRWLALWFLLFSACRARFFADGVFAIISR